MKNTPEPNNEAARLRALREHAIMDTLPEPHFDEIVRRTAALCETPIALLTLVDDRRQWFKARYGFALPELPRTIGFDAIAMQELQPLIIPDATADKTFACDPLVLSELNIRSYAGVPLIADDGFALGALSVMDYTPRNLSPAQLKALAEQAQQAILHLDMRRKVLMSSEAGATVEPVQIVPRESASDTEPRVILPDVMMRFGRDFRYSYVSPFAIEAIGIRPDALLGREVGAERVPVAFADSLKSALERTVQNRRIEEIEFLYMSPSGERLFQTRLMPEMSGGEVTAILSITREVLPEEKAAPAPAPRRPELRALLGIAIAESGSMPELLQRCAEAIAEFSSAPLVRIWLRDIKNGLLLLRANAGAAAGLMPGEPGRTALELPTGADTPDDFADRAFSFEAHKAEENDLTATAAMPLKAGNLLLGMITLRDQSALPDEVQDELLETSGTVAMAVRRGQDADALTEQATSLAKDLLDARLALQRESENAASLAHELRTPLSGVLGLTNLLLGTALDPAQRELSEMTRSSAKALLHMVNETLDTSKPEEREVVLEAVPFDMREVVEDVAALLADKAQGKGIALVVRCSPQMPERLIGDAGRIRQILTNLVHNAVKFTREGYILIDAASNDPVDGMASISIEVEDTGIGIPLPRQEAIFDRYIQAGSIPNEESGAGLGLAISREYAEKMGGTIQVKSQLDSGSIFHLTLNLPVDTETAPNKPAAVDIEGLRALIVDGHELQQFAIREMMRSAGVRVNLSATTGEMLDAMQAGLHDGEPFQVILLDESMAGSDSRAIIQAVLTTSAFEQARLVILTSVARNREVERMVAEGLALSLTKPVRRQPLLDALTRIAGELPPRPLQEQPAETQLEPEAEEIGNELPREPAPAVESEIDRSAPVDVSEVPKPSDPLDQSDQSTQPDPVEVTAVAGELAPEYADAEEPWKEDSAHLVATETSDEALPAASAAVSQPEVSGPTVHDTATHEPDDNEYTDQEAATHEPETNEHTDHEPAKQEPEISEPADDEPEKQDSDTSEPTDTEPAGQEPTDHEPEISEPTAEEAADQEQATYETGASDRLPYSPLPSHAPSFEETTAADGTAGQDALDEEDARAKTYALVIEDDTVNQRVARMMLEKMGCVVDVASSGNDALQLFETRVYDLVLIDCRMNGMDGYETTAKLRRMEAGERHTSIVAVTADTSPGVHDRCLDAGMDAYISKPINAEALQYEIEKLLNNPPPARESRRQMPIDEILDRRALMARVAGNTEVLRSLANLCQAECSRLMAEIREAIASGDRSEFLRATHKLRGNIMSMEARASVEAVRRLELTANQGRPADAEDMLDPLQAELDRLLTAMNEILDEADAAG